MQSNEYDGRLWKTLDAINERLSGIESKLLEVVRLEEKAANHGDAISRHTSQLESLEIRVHNSELWQAHIGDKEAFDKFSLSINAKIDDLNSKIEDIEVLRSRSAGRQDIVKYILSTAVLILSSVLVYNFTQG